MDPVFDISIIISSYNRKDKVLLTVEQLFKSNLEGFNIVELIVIDDGSPSPVEKALENMGPVPVKIEFRLITQKNAGIGATRNRGFREAKAPVVIFLDDDILLEPGTIRELYNALQEGPGPVLFGNYPFISHSSGSLHHFARQLYGYDSITRERSFEKVDAITSGLLAVNKEQLKGVTNFYKDDLTVPAAEEYEIIARFHRMQVPIYKARHISALHNHHLEIRWLVQQQYKYGQGTAEAFVKYPEIKELDKFSEMKKRLDAQGRSLLKGAVASGFGRKLLFLYVRLTEKLLKNKKRNFILGILTTAYFWAGYKDGLKRFLVK
ncbi:MAG: glycosyltransferase family 2 protein [Chitinophagaceae bacterium]